VETQVSWDRVSELFPHVQTVREEAHRALAEAKDPSLLAGLNDVLHYDYVVREPRHAARIEKTMEAIAGDKVGRDPRRGWAELVQASERA
jgi:hypothetical protein